MKTSDLSIKELAAFIGVSTDTIRRAARRGEIPAIREKTALRFDLQEVLTYLQRPSAIRFGGENRENSEFLTSRCGREVM
jgi:excisionase family DNA binding protein